MALNITLVVVDVVATQAVAVLVKLHLASGQV